MHREVDWRGLNFHVELIDIQQLNRRLFAGEFDVAKVSFHAALLLSDDVVVLPSGSALGFGVGPLLLAARPGDVPEQSAQVTLCPGEHTTAALLFQMFYPESTTIQHVVFSEIMPMLQRHAADFGVCIHEGRFTWQQQNLGLVEDLGVRWESETGCPLPLGGIIGRKRLGHDLLLKIQDVISDSLQFALANREAPLPTMRHHAQEFSDDVLMQHVDLYVNEWTVRLGEVGRNALAELSRRGRAAGICSPQQSSLDILSVDSTTPKP